MHTSERRLGLLDLEPPERPLEGPSRRHHDEPAQQAAFPTSTAVRRLLLSVAGISVLTSVLAVQSLSTRPGDHQWAIAVGTLVLLPVLWACSLGVYLSRRRSVLAYGSARQRLSALSDLTTPRPNRESALAEASVQAILRGRKLRTQYQPIVSVSNGKVIGAEALTHFSATPEATPDVWFARAAEVGLGVELELVALSTALESAHLLPDHIYLSINLSPDALADPRVAALLQDGRWPCRQLVIEVTEHVSVTDYASLAHTVAALRQLGVRIAVDDAGAGYASFRHILKLHPDYIKLDRALIDGIDRDAAKRALAGAFVAFGDELDILIIAEGVETAAELSAARALGVHAAQGFHTGRPRPPGETWGL
ncbi:MAG TPA: EAL domain-containing protein [Actinomycetales bacterium]|nr:EAL domain-containing protein [Actinomycetales bacterium]